MGKITGTFNVSEFKHTMLTLAGNYDREVGNKEARSQYQKQSHTDTEPAKHKPISSLTEEEWERYYGGSD